MGPGRIPLRLDATRCDRCGRCVQACPEDALKVGRNYIYVDWRACDGCQNCAEACDRGAISRREATTSATPTPAGARPAGVRPSAARPSAAPEAGTPRWTLLEAWALLSILVLTFLGKDAIMASEAVRGLEAGETVLVRVWVLFGFYALQVGVLLLFAHRRGLHPFDAFRLRAGDVEWRARLGSVVLVVGLLVLVRVGGWVYGLTAQWLGWDPPVREISELTEVFGPTPLGLLLSVALVVVVAPVVEEVVFRGVLQGAFVLRWGRHVGVGLAAGLFALYHFTPWLFAPLFALGLACGWLAESRRSLLPAISLHASYNVIPVAIAFYLAWWS